MDVLPLVESACGSTKVLVATKKSAGIGKREKESKNYLEVSADNRALLKKLQLTYLEPRVTMSCIQQLQATLLQPAANMCNNKTVDDVSYELLLGTSASSTSSSGFPFPFCMDEDDPDLAAYPEQQEALTFYLQDGRSQSIVVEEGLRCIDLCHLLTLKLNVARSPTWTLVERLADIGIERSLEDHEEVLNVYSSWEKDCQKNNKFYFVQDFRKYEFFHNPQQFFPLEMVDLDSQIECLAESTDLAKSVTLQNLLNSGERSPVVHSQLWCREPGKQSWKRSFFQVEGGTLYTSSSGVKDLWQLHPIIDLNQCNIFVPVDKTDTAGPTSFQFCLKCTKSEGESSTEEPMWFCSDSDRQRQCWIIALRLAKFGKKLRENYKEVRSRYADVHWNKSEENSPEQPWVAMDFTGSKGGRVIDDPKEAEAIAAAEAHNWKRKLPCCRSGHISPLNGPNQGSPGSSRPRFEFGIHLTQPWFYGGMSREEATQLLTRYGTVDGVFLVRESFSKPGTFVLCYVYKNKVHHCQIIPVEEKDQLCYSVDGGRTKFYDLIQLIEFYQLNISYLPTKLTHFLVHHPKPKKDIQ